MKVISIIGGLGSQMFKYAFYLAIKEKCSGDVLIDTTCYLQREYPYLINNIFDQHAPDIKDIMTTKELNDIKNKNIDYIDCCLKKILENGRTAYYILGTKHMYTRPPIPFFRIAQQKGLYFLHKNGVRYTFEIDDVINEKNAYYNEYYHMSDIHFAFCKDVIKKAFIFPAFPDMRNKEMSEKILEETSVAIHIRRTDYSKINNRLIESGYYKSSVNYIKSKENNDLSFYVFSDDFEWCKSNLDKMGLCKNDKVVYVDWNSGNSSYMDMQLMTYCKHNVISNSAFSWWGDYLSCRDGKIACAPKGFWYNIDNHF